ncbi:MAG: DUF4349 domain-containing protein [Actinomycetota bacterium]
MRAGNDDSRRAGGRWRLLAVLIALLLVAAACSGDDSADEASTETEAFEGDFDDGSSASASAIAEEDGDFDLSTADSEGEAMADDEAMEEEAAEAEPPAEPAADGPLGAGGATVTPTAADLGRQLIFTAVLRVEVDDVAAASAEATAIVEARGGFLFGQNTRGGTEASSELTFKVLPEDFNAVLEDLGSVGELRNQSVTTDDVTERIVDLGSRIEVAELGVTRLREALAGSQTLEDYAELERLLLERESDLEVMRGQLRTLQDRVDLATITLILDQDQIRNDLVVQVSSYPGFDGGVSCPVNEVGRVEEGGELTVCFDVINAGDQTLTDIVLTDTVLGIDAGTELLPVFGSLDELPPGQAALVAYEFEPERSLVLRTRVVAIPTDGVSSEQAGPSVSTQVNHDIRTFEPDTDPGFGDGFGAAVDILRGLWVGFLVVLGFLIPLLVLLPILWVLWFGIRWLLARRPAPATPPPPRPQTQTPPPPPPPAGPGAPPAEVAASMAGDQPASPGPSGD